MEKKILTIVSICAVFFLVLGLFSNVVGYQSVKSIVNDSPLFQTRTQRATNQQQNIFTSHYLGEEKGNLWQIPSSDTRTEKLKKVIEIISKMDKTSFERFKALCVQRAIVDDIFNGLDPNNIKGILNLLRKQSSTIYNLNNNDENNRLFTMDCTIYQWFPGCVLCRIIYMMIMVPTVFIIFLIMFVIYILRQHTTRCDIS